MFEELLKFLAFRCVASRRRVEGQKQNRMPTKTNADATYSQTTIRTCFKFNVII